MPQTTKYSRDDLRVLIRDRSLTHQAIADRIGCSRKLITETLAGRSNGRSTQWAICQILGVDVDDVRWETPTGDDT